MRIQITSDLHIDHTMVDLSLAGGADLLIVAGDVCEGTEHGDGLARGLPWLRERVPGSTPIVAIMGNHEPWHRAIDEHVSLGRAVAARHGITFLENEVAVVGGVRFIGCTLWTDYTLRGDAWQEVDMSAARDTMADHRRIMLSNRPRITFRPRDAAFRHLESKAFLRAAASAPFDGPTVIVTHHAPSRGSLRPGRAVEAIDAAFVNDMDDVVAGSGAALWIHGHSHHSFDYSVGSTRVIANPHGYGTENARDYDPALVVDL